MRASEGCCRLEKGMEGHGVRLYGRLSADWPIIAFLK